MAYYLSMDGVDDKIQAPSMTFTKIVMDVKIPRKTDVTRMYVDLRTGLSFGYFQSTTGGVDSTGTGTISVYVDGAGPKSNNTVMVPNDVRSTVEVRLSSAVTDNATIFSRNDGAANFQSGNIYDIKFYNDATLVAHYDMTTQTVNDQTGNGNHATLTGGSWLDDGAGGGITVNAVTANATASSMVPAITTQQQITVSSVVANANADALAPSVGSFTNITVNAVIANATASANAPSMEVIRNISQSAPVSNATANALVPNVGSPVPAQITAVIATLTVNAIAPIVSILQSPVIVGTIKLKGQQVLSTISLKGETNSAIHLNGEKTNSTIHLKGGIQ